MKKQLFAAAIAVAGFVLPAHATPQLRNLLDAVRATGTTISVDDPRFCKDPSTLGYYVHRRNVIDQLTLCVANHKGNNEELYDTILHESVHVAQACKGGPIYTLHSLLKESTGDQVVFLKDTYPQDQFHEELEARVIARDQDEVFVTGLIKEHCK